MNDTFLGKITKVHFGTDGDRRFGLTLDFKGESTGCTFYQGVWAGERPTHAQWSEQDRKDKLVELNFYIIEILNDAKKRNIHELLNMPVEVTTEGNMLKSWRILTEVL